MFALRFAWRDTRSSRRRLAIASCAIVFGVAALVSVGCLKETLHRAVDLQARSLVGADAVATFRGEPSAEADALLANSGATIARETALSSTVVYRSAKDVPQLANIRGIEPAYPFFGDIETFPAGAAKRLGEGDYALVEGSLMQQWGAAPGDPLNIGNKTFKIAGAIDRMPGDTPGFAALAPRVVVSRNALEGTGLRSGPLVRHRAYLKYPEGADAGQFSETLRKPMRKLRMRLETTEQRKEDLGNAVDVVHAFLNLVGTIALFLGAVGVAGAIEAHVREKLATVAVLRCLGAGAYRCFSVYLIQSAAIGLAGAAIGTLAGLGLFFAIPRLFADMLPVTPEMTVIPWKPVGLGFLSGFVICVLFALLPLVSIRRVSPLRAIRSAYEARPPGIDFMKIAVWAAIVAAAAGLVLSQVPGLRAAAGFFIGLIVIAGVPAAVAKLLIVLARRFRFRAFPYVVRQGVSNLYRPNNRTMPLMMTLGIGTTLLLVPLLARETILAQIGDFGGKGAPNMILFDIQPDQLPAMEAALRKANAEPGVPSPIVTMRLKSVKDRDVSASLAGEVPGGEPSRFLGREYRATYRETTTDTEKVVEGTFEGRAVPGEETVPVSLERTLAKDLGVTIGDRLVFDVQGLPVAARVGSIREVNWRRLSPNFFVVFPAGVLEEAPRTYIAAARAPGSVASGVARAEIARALPNVSTVDLGTVLGVVDKIFSRITAVVGFVAFFMLGTGAVVLAGAMLASRSQRIRESVLLRTLGASRRQIAGILFVEYAMLGVLGAGVGAILAVASNLALARLVFDAPPVFAPGTLAATFAGVAGLSVLTGSLSTRGVTRHPPLEVLRNE